ncbi:GNAT family N-acetyltransferase [Halalkalibacillus halophilus]|uniref:GNAT family N-acetyltransferase n=1 Tax=Halalkalibacillus halophilus TaxID=392827 RepID=UPI00040661AE|nr:GNAT family N-acetyltransferase [Halalkalibacillus halophilus]
MIIRRYQSEDEQGWLRCRVLSFLDTAYFDNVLQAKESYENPSIELVVLEDDMVVGLMDIEYEKEPNTVCARGNGRGGMIWHVATHPDYQRRGYGERLLKEAEKLARELEIDYLEAWTRDDQWVNLWYEKFGFEKFQTYLHVVAVGNDEVGKLVDQKKGYSTLQAFAHYNGTEVDEVKNSFTRVHECNGYAKTLRN